MVDTIAQSSSEKKAGKAVGSFRNLSENHNITEISNKSPLFFFSFLSFLSLLTFHFPLLLSFFPSFLRSFLL